MGVHVFSCTFFEEGSRDWDKRAESAERWGWALNKAPETPAPVFNLANLKPSEKRALGEQLLREAEAAETAVPGGATRVDEKSVTLAGIRLRRRG